MQIVLRKETESKRIVDYLSENYNIKSDVILENNNTIINLFGDIESINKEELESLEEVEKVINITENYKKANRKMYSRDSIIDVCGKKFGEGFFNVIAGPCSIESKEQLIKTAESVKKSGAGLLRGGAFKPRSSPYTFQGLRNDGLKLLLETKRLTGMPIVTEIMRIDTLDLFEDVDIIQVGTRNMQNFELLKELGKTKKTILLKRGMASTLDELLMSAEYIMAGGNSNIILCERGIRTFETSMRNTLDISAIPMLKKKTHLPVIVDPSHAAGLRFMVEPLSMAAIAAGADGLIIEVHNNPDKALCDGQQSLGLKSFEELMKKINKTAEFFGKRG